MSAKPVVSVKKWKQTDRRTHAHTRTSLKRLVAAKILAILLLVLVVLVFVILVFVVLVLVVLVLGNTANPGGGILLSFTQCQTCLTMV